MKIRASCADAKAQTCFPEHIHLFFYLSSIHPLRTLQKNRWIVDVLRFVIYQEGNPIGGFIVLHASELRVACSIFSVLELLLNVDHESARLTGSI